MQLFWYANDCTTRRSRHSGSPESLGQPLRPFLLILPSSDTCASRRARVASGHGVLPGLTEMRVRTTRRRNRTSTFRHRRFLAQAAGCVRVGLSLLLLASATSAALPRKAPDVVLSKGANSHYHNVVAKGQPLARQTRGRISLRQVRIG